MLNELWFKVVIFLALSILSKHAYSQKIVKKDSTIYLSEVIIENIKNPSITKLKTKGSRNEIRGFNKPNSKFVSLVKNIPKGQLTAISFFFNPGMLSKNFEYDLGLLIYDLDINGKPGTFLPNNEIKFKLKSNGKGKITLDLKKLFLNSEENLFFGFAVYNDISRNPLLVKFIESKDAVSFCKESEIDWMAPIAEIPIQLNLVVEVDEEK